MGFGSRMFGAAVKRRKKPFYGWSLIYIKHATSQFVWLDVIRPATCLLYWNSCRNKISFLPPPRERKILRCMSGKRKVLLTIRIYDITTVFRQNYIIFLSGFCCSFCVFRSVTNLMEFLPLFVVVNRFISFSPGRNPRNSLASPC